MAALGSPAPHKPRIKHRRHLSIVDKRVLIFPVLWAFFLFGLLFLYSRASTRSHMLDHAERLGRPFMSDGTGPLSADSNLDRTKAEVVRSMMRHAWNGYETYAWGMDELNPISKRGKVGIMGGFGGFSGQGATLVDAMSTLYVMGLHEEFGRARDWVAQEMDFEKHGEQKVSFFETTIRLLGGLLSAYDLSGDQVRLRSSCFAAVACYSFVFREL